MSGSGCKQASGTHIVSRLETKARDTEISLRGVTLLNRRHCIYLDELQAELYNIRGTSLSQPTLMRTLHQLHYSHKCVTTRALERDDLICFAFMNRIANEVLNPDMLIFIDKAARNRRASAQAKGWSLVGRRCVQRRHFICGQRFSILPILMSDGIITYCTISFRDL